MRLRIIIASNSPAMGTVSPTSGAALPAWNQSSTVSRVNGPTVLARGPWRPEEIGCAWRAEPFEASPEAAAAADQKVAALAAKGSPSHDGLAARLFDFTYEEGRLALELQPVRWSLRLVEGDAQGSLAALCLVRSRDGRWLAGRRASWLATWAGRWALGAGGAVEVDENPVETLSRELEEEWSLIPTALSVEALLRLPGNVTMLIGLAEVPDDPPLVRDAEHDDHAWWPADPADWPIEPQSPLRAMAAFLAS